MQARLSKYWSDIHASYWFIPTLMSFAAVVLAIALAALDSALGADWASPDSWLFNSRPEGARALLAAIAGSMITVAGVTFSVTISAVAYATSQFGPHLLTHFMQDRGNQITLGTFIATFIYCLLVLRAVRNAEALPTGSDAETALSTAFVPQLAILGALGLALASVAVLIYFIHHVPATIHISNVAARLGLELQEQIERLHPQHSEEAPVALPLSQEQLQARYQAATPIRSEHNGYLQHLNYAGLLTIAEQHDLLLFVARQPGDFIVERQPLLYAWPALKSEHSVREHIHDCFAFGLQRTQAQDFMFLIQELVEITVRALSPGINDPFTAINCMNWLAPSLAVLARRPPRSACHYDTQGQPRVLLSERTFQTVATTVFDSLRPYVKRDRSAALHLLRIMAELAPDAIQPGAREALAQHAQALGDGCQEALDQIDDREAVGQYCAEVIQAIRDPLMQPRWNKPHVL